MRRKPFAALLTEQGDRRRGLVAMDDEPVCLALEREHARARSRADLGREGLTPAPTIAAPEVGYVSPLWPPPGNSTRPDWAPPIPPVDVVGNVRPFRRR